MRIHHKLDAGLPDTNTVVVLCREPGCPWRSLANDKAEAYALLDRHGRKEHTRKNVDMSINWSRGTPDAMVRH